MAKLRGLGSGRVGVALVPAGVGAALGYALLKGLGVGPVVATGLSVTMAVGGTLWLSSHLPAELNGALRRHTCLAILWLALGLSACSFWMKPSSKRLELTRSAPQHTGEPGRTSC